MRPLLSKDLRLLAPWAWLIVPAHMLWCVQALLSPELYFWTNLAAAVGWTAAILGIEWRLDADRFIASLPVSRATIVNARYISAFAALALGAALYAAYGHAIGAVAGDRLMERWPGTPAWASIDGVLAFFAAGAALLVVFLPLHFRLGLPLAGAIAGVLAGFAVIAVVALSPAGLMSGAPTAAGALAARAEPAASLALPSEAIRAWVSSLAASWGAGLATLTVLGSAGLLAAASARLAAWFHEGREL